MTTKQFKLQVLPIKDKLYRYALSIVCDEDLAKDIVQDVFMKLWNQREKLKQIENMEAWSMTVTRNHCLDLFRKKKMHVVDLTEAKHQISGHDVADHLSINNDLMEKIQYALTLLPEKQKEIFRLRDLVGYSNQEIEKILDLSLITVK